MGEESAHTATGRTVGGRLRRHYRYSASHLCLTDAADFSLHTAVQSKIAEMFWTLLTWK